MLRCNWEYATCVNSVRVFREKGYFLAYFLERAEIMKENTTEAGC